MSPSLINRSKKRMPRKFLHAWVRKLSRELRKIHPSVSKKELVVVFVGPKEMTALNYEFRGKKYPTDVLSFAPVEMDSLGELILCPQVLEKQCLETGLTYQRELGYMIVHGCLHLLGYDHETSRRDEKAMFALQDKIFARLIL
jgi:probable rRNA maturation factor